MPFNKFDKRIWLKGLVMECPAGEPLHDCPLNGMRSLPITQINHTINDLSDEKVDAIINIHKHCFHDRTKAMEHPTP
jgi:hypothetical protein